MLFGKGVCADKTGGYVYQSPISFVEVLSPFYWDNTQPPLLEQAVELGL